MKYRGREIIFVEGQAPGAVPNGARVRKAIKEKGDGHPVGALGFALSSFVVPINGKNVCCYFVEWDSNPGLPVFVVGHKIEAAPTE